MKKLAGLALLLVIVFGAQAFLAPMPRAGVKGKGPRCTNTHYCTIEPDGTPSCGPCEYWEWCGTQCGCRPIPGCKL